MRPDPELETLPAPVGLETASAAAAAKSGSTEALSTVAMLTAPVAVSTTGCGCPFAGPALRCKYLILNNYILYM